MTLGCRDYVKSLVDIEKLSSATGSRPVPGYNQPSFRLFLWKYKSGMACGLGAILESAWMCDLFRKTSVLLVACPRLCRSIELDIRTEQPILQSRDDTPLLQTRSPPDTRYIPNNAFILQDIRSQPTYNNAPLYILTLFKRNGLNPQPSSPAPSPSSMAWHLESLYSPYLASPCVTHSEPQSPIHGDNTRSFNPQIQYTVLAPGYAFTPSGWLHHLQSAPV